MNLKEATLKVLEQSEEARANDPLLIAEVFKMMGWSTDLQVIALNPVNKFGTITRYRRKAQQTNPLLKASEETTQKRKAKEEEFKRIARGI